MYIQIKILWVFRPPNAYMRSWHYQVSVYHTHICVGGTPGVKQLFIVMVIYVDHIEINHMDGELILFH